MPAKQATNDDIADQLEQIASLIETQDGNSYRVRSYRDAAGSVRGCSQSVAQMAENDADSLKELPNVGQKLAGLIEEFVKSGRLPLLERLQSELSPQMVLQRVPGIGEELASRIVQQLGIRTLEELERAAHDGRLQKLEGFGDQRVQAVRDSLAGILSRSAVTKAKRRQQSTQSQTERPPVGLLLEIDATYRDRADKDELKKIAPRRFNPSGEAWLPIMHMSKDVWTFTVLYSNTSRAHEVGATHDWVVIYYKQDGHESQCTVVTATRGKLKGRRIIRGREAECRQYYMNDQ